MMKTLSVQLPNEHGRLGDLDKLYVRIRDLINQHSQIFDDTAMLYLESILDEINDAETLIDASGN